MKKIKAFFYVLFKSLSSVEYYKDVLKTKLSFSMKYFLFLSLVLSILATVKYSLSTIPLVNKTITDVFSQITLSYPDDFEISSKLNKWAINKTEPFSINTPTVLSEQTDFPKNFITFYHNGTINDLKNLDTLILVNEANVVTKDNKGKIEAYPIDSLPDGTFTKQTLVEGFNKVQVYIKYVPIIMVSAIFSGLMFNYIVFRILTLINVAIILWLFGNNIKSLKLKFSKYLQIAIHTATLGALLNLLFIVTGINLPIPFWFFLVTAVFGIIIVLFISSDSTKTLEVTEQPQETPITQEPQQ